ncbi:hypothetical protein HYH03_010367 [Edaphochlamys debaryana]|uniref:Uncharacterized protein n=1 Tax=Edaphochlamys debaryana TaxID=47281 RepID=A0A835XX05_9CHLO|nr:hypothetical protein HYH03_010367 [Edaphochlamys debaryana]|eukprot:KAG2491369.1 hypothetical protein HYH03_010367 [Edaphochlamys debaryana]
MRSWHVALFFLLAVPSLQAASLPTSLTEPRWNPLPVWKDKSRVWDRDLLDKGILNLGSLASFKRFFDKLDRGERVVAVAYGSSFIHDFAGCFQTSLQALWDLNIVPNPMLYPQQGADVSLEAFATTAPRCASGGFLEGVMASINATWPNYKHIFVNNGKGGACLTFIVEASCMSSFTPEKVDLLFIDTLTNQCHGMEKSAEKMVRQFLSAPDPPLVALLSNARTCLGTNEYGNQCAWECLREHKGSRTAWQCQNLTAPYTAPADEEFNNDLVKGLFQPVAKYYDIGHVNYYDMIKPIMLSDLNEKHGMAKFEFLYRFYTDWVHFNKPDLGTVWGADAVLNWLVRGQEALAALSPEQRAALSYTLPSTAMDASANEHYVTRCYGLTLKAAVEYVKKGVVASLDKVTMDHFHQANPGDDFEFIQMSVTHNPAQALPPFDVIQNKGWRLQMYYMTARGAHKLKPGWLTDEAGSILDFTINSSFNGVTAPGEQVETLYTYTKSYDGWGIAQFSCIANCVCESRDVDAHVGADGAKTSLTHVVKIRVSQHERCVIRMEVLQRTSSSGHKFKLASMMVRALKKTVPT